MCFCDLRRSALMASPEAAAVKPDFSLWVPSCLEHLQILGLEGNHARFTFSTQSFTTHRGNTRWCLAFCPLRV